MHGDSVAVRVGRPVAERRGSEHVVTADVDGEPVWFSSPDLEPAGGAEAFGSALLIPALHAGGGLRIAGRADLRWRANAARAARMVAGWWDYDAAPVRVAARWRPRRRRAPVVLCFTGGVDSFYSLRRLRPDVLVYVCGYDVALEDEDRARRVERLVRDVARETGAAAVILRSNLREHPVAAAVNWERSHGGALAAAGHLLDPLAGTLAISSGVNRERAHPWGSHWQLDPLWSSSALEVRHVGDDIWHNAKLRELAGDPLAQRHLRVCWQHLTGDLNCSRCEKCLITMTVLADTGRLEQFANFDGTEALPERIAALHATRYLYGWGRVLDEGLEPAVAEEVARLLERSRPSVGQTSA